jgi:hypothetical protein
LSLCWAPFVFVLSSPTYWFLEQHIGFSEARFLCVNVIFGALKRCPNDDVYLNGALNTDAKMMFRAVRRGSYVLSFMNWICLADGAIIFQVVLVYTEHSYNIYVGLAEPYVYIWCLYTVFLAGNC